MKIKKLLKLGFILLFFLSFISSFNSISWAAKHPTEACWDVAGCDQACGPLSCQDTGCEFNYPYGCIPAQSGGNAVDIGRDFMVGFSGISGRSGFNNISSFVSSILPNVYIIAGIILLFLIIGAGFAIMSSTDDPQKKGQGGKALTAAIVGFLIIFASYWIIQIIEKITGVPILINKIGI